MLLQNYSKYFIAIIPPSPVYEQAEGWKEYFKTEYNSKAALRSPPHITLHMPFQWKIKKEEKLIEELLNFTQTQKLFDLALKDFGCFEPRVIFINVEPSNQLTQLQSALSKFCKVKLNLFNANRHDQPFNPHLTVAFRDLKKSVFPHAWSSVKEKEFYEVFPVEQVCLLKHDGKKWNAFKELKFGGDCLVPPMARS